MSTKYNTSLFETLKDTINNKTNIDSYFKDFMKMEAGKTYIVRLVPNVENINNSWFEYSQHIWKSVVTGKVTSVICPNTYKDKCPICEYRSKIWATKDQTLIDQIKPLKKSDKCLYNVYVISDPTNPDNQGKVKILNAGTQLDKIIRNAGFGEDSDEFGSKIFDLTENGCNLQIKVETNEGGYPTYTSSRFKSPCKIEGLDDDEKINAVYESFIPLDTIYKRKSYNEVKDLLDIHFLGKDVTTVNNTIEEEEFKLETTNIVDDVKITSSKKDNDDDEEDSRIKDILKDL
jgi:hypothetical protein